MSWVDCTEFWRENGIEFKALTSEGADLKSTFHLEPNETQLAFLQESINESGRRFREHVEEGRGKAGVRMDDEVWRAGWYCGNRAGELGLIDELGSAEEARQNLLALTQ
jgi:ClpP class serine protease